LRHSWSDQVELHCLLSSALCKTQTLLQVTEAQWHPHQQPIWARSVFRFGLCLQTADSSWQFDVFAFAEATPGHTLSVLFIYLVKQSGVLDGLHLDEGKLCNFLQKMDCGYDPLTPYHNR
jgi:hypothetical protein